jgi:hypothetical protein
MDQEPGQACGLAGRLPGLPGIADTVPDPVRSAPCARVILVEVREEPGDHTLGLPLQLPHSGDLGAKHRP